MFRQSLADKLNELFKFKADYRSYENLIVNFNKENAATGEEINLIKSQMEIPNDYLNFLTQYNGCTLFQFEDFGGFTLFGTTDLTKENNFQKNNLEGYCESNIIFFCEVIGDGDFIGFKCYNDGTYEVLDCYHDALPKDWAVINNSFGDFLEKLIDEKGKRYWLDSPK